MDSEECAPLKELGVKFGSVFVENRKKVWSALSAGDVVLLQGSEEKFRNADTELPFRQDSNFLYVWKMYIKYVSKVLI